jgi:hypothetical protein
MATSGEARGTWIKRLGRYALIIAAGWGALSFLARRSVFHPMKHPEGWWQLQARIGAEDAWITARDGVKLHGWFVGTPDARHPLPPRQCRQCDAPGTAMLAIREAGSSVLVLDYGDSAKGAVHRNGVTSMPKRRSIC